MTKVKRVTDSVAGICEKIGIIITAVCGMIVLLALGYQVITRAFFPKLSVLWTSEVAKLGMIIATFSGGATCLRRGDLIAMTFITDKIKGKAKSIYFIFAHILCLLFLIIFDYYGIKCVPVYKRILSMTMPMNYAWVIAMVSFGGILMTLVQISIIVNDIDELNNGEYKDKMISEGGNVK